ncbi:MarC family protein [Flavobacterium sp. UBA6031]|uniref:MarC family protein n=1 Tax=Flavobacterium sp. UBA6031 TaxID=1946551 RepID=UPI0025C35F6A|nr:MarC family protein [Flavobacterium sp. UBA6031]
MESLWSFALTVFMAFFAIMNPIANVPIFVKLTEGLSQKEKIQVAKTANIVAFIIIVSFILIGKYIFEIFGLTIPAFKVFGGVLIFFIGFDMLYSKKTNVHIEGTTAYDESIAISPLAIPILAGPGTIVTAMNFVVTAGIIPLLLTILIFGFIILITYFAFIYSSYIVKFVGDKKFVVIGKIMGLIIGVLGANMLIQGIKMAFNI